MEKQIESLWKSYGAIQELIRFADSKATAILAIDGVFAGFFFSNISSIREILRGNILEVAPLSLMLICLILSASFSAWCIAPRLDKNSNCFFFFCDIARNYKTSSEFEKAFKEAPRGKILSDIAQQVHVNSGIAKKKHKFVWLSIYFFAASLLASVIFMVTALWG